MATLSVFRLTKTKQFVLNNGWENVKVYPKHTLFFIPKEKDTIEAWKEFLCRSHNRSFLYLHNVTIKYLGAGLKLRLLHNTLPEIMVKDDSLLSVKVHKTVKVFKNLPINWTYLPMSKKEKR